MARYLTPARICLLSLVRAYQAGQASSESTLPVLDFIARQIIPSAEDDHLAANEWSILSCPDISPFVDQLRTLSSRYPGRTMYDVVLDAMWTMRGLDSLHTLVDEQDPETSGIIARSLTPTSPLGQFIRRCYVEFARMQFDESMALWKAFAEYRAPTYNEWERKNPNAAANLQISASNTSVPVMSDFCDESSLATQKSSGSTIDVDMLLGFAIHRLQKMGTRVPEDVRLRLEQWIGAQSDSSTQSLHFFMSFLEHWRSGQYTMALESLHRYFDYSLAARGSSTDNMKVYYQYALLHLSVLHADFECWEQSVDAMNECIATARENQDIACLNYALSWLLYLRHAYPSKGKSPFDSIAGVVGSGGSEYDEIRFLKQKAREGKHWMLLSSTLLEEAKLEMYSGGSNSRAHEHVLQAMYLNMHHDLRSLAPAATLFEGASLDRLGQAHLADCYYELPNLIHAQHCPLNDRARSACRTALKLAQCGLYSRALGIVDNLMFDVQGVLKMEQRVKAFAALIHLRRNLYRDDTDAVKFYLNQLKPLRSGSDPEMVYEINVMEIEALTKRERFEEALRKVNERLQESKSEGVDLAQRLYYLILKGKVFAAGGQGCKTFAAVLRATCMAEHHTILPVLFEGLAVLSKILIELSEFQAARDILEAVLPHAVEFNNIELTAQLYVTIAEACVGFAGHASDIGSVEQVRSMRKAQAYIEQGRVAYERIEDVKGMLDCLLMKIKLALWSGDETTATQADEMYMQLLMDE